MQEQGQCDIYRRAGSSGGPAAWQLLSAQLLSLVHEINASVASHIIVALLDKVLNKPLALIVLSPCHIAFVSGPKVLIACTSTPRSCDAADYATLPVFHCGSVFLQARPRTLSFQGC